MVVRVDEARQHGHAAAVDGLVGRRGQRVHRPDGLDDVAAHVDARIGELAAAVVHRRDDGRVREQQRAEMRHRATLLDAAGAGELAGPRSARTVRRGERWPRPCRSAGRMR